VILGRKDSLGVVPVSREPVHQRVYEQLRNLLMSGHFSPGQPLTITELASAFGTSAQPVRDAIRQLVAEKALTASPNRSVVVPVLDRAAMEDLRAARLAIEGLAAELGAARATKADIDELERLVAHETEADSADRIEEAVAQNRAFHTKLYGLSGSRVLPPIVDSLWLQIGPYIRRTLDYIDVQGGPSLHHVEAIEALRGGEPAKVRAAIERDIGRFFEIAFEVVGNEADVSRPDVA